MLPRRRAFICWANSLTHLANAVHATGRDQATSLVANSLSPPCKGGAGIKQRPCSRAKLGDGQRSSNDFIRERNDASRH